MWSNSRGIGAFLDPRPLSKQEKARLVKTTLVKRHTDPKTGTKRFTGKAKVLKDSGCLRSMLSDAFQSLNAV